MEVETSEKFKKQGSVEVLELIDTDYTHGGSIANFPKRSIVVRKAAFNPVYDQKIQQDTQTVIKELLDLYWKRAYFEGQLAEVQSNHKIDKILATQQKQHRRSSST